MASKVRTSVRRRDVEIGDQAARAGKLIQELIDAGVLRKR